ncbi:hypothetical protein UFOVP991_24 [uncultured Caudovirales phage]|uniref:Uncharacterized protein n=1 Tax=uncultured Caudovirales phage TaxID=2100421 RepID=A0A6J5QJY6_9CAUD|nr:hypothetical protein UFOVP991_24 [uncultured Caudovirales phage]CAB4182786.1 hypothetical protein UFOVP1076_24 [uncultured Caudovirales phage]CAB4197419.1 hypothetical protein UFOVP1314_7 [uncultured Caudovirales phage]CAB4211278.1 hypothetical protein UFOVP1427_3 [uncultured Caudovirales phage]CAB5237963.1 hypothetical protein UFOVP1523_7 [uncultured Caudovirales phage]
MRTSMFLLLWLCSSFSLAADPALPILIVSDNGYAWMIQDSNGKPVIYEFAHVIVLGKPATLPQPPSTSVFGLEAPIRKLITGLSPTSRLDLPAVLKGVNDTVEMVKANRFKTTGEVEAVAAALIGAAIKDKVGWGPVAIAIDEALVKLQKDGKIKTVADYGLALSEIAKALQ